MFLLGGDEGDVYIDNVKMFRTSIDYSDVDIYPLNNGDFSQGKIIGTTGMTAGAFLHSL